MTKGKVCEDLVGLSGPFTKIARTMSAQWGVRIIPSGTKCQTDGEVIHIPFTADFLPLERRQVLHGMLDHEICHVAEERRHREVSRKTPMEIFKEETNKKKRSLLNVFEDIRIEKYYEAIFPGMAENIGAGNVEYADKWASDHAVAEKVKFWDAFCIALILRGRELRDEWTYEGEMGEWMSLVEDEIAESRKGGEWVETSRLLTDRVYEKIKKRIEEKEKEQKEEESGGDKDKRTGDSEEDSGQQYDYESDPDMEDVSEAQKADMSDYVIKDARDFNRYIPHPKAAAKDLTVKAEDMGTLFYEAPKAEVMAQIAGLRGRQRMLIMSNARKRLRTGLESGFVDEDALSEAKTGNTKVFSNVMRRRAMNTAITGVVDVSGSMSRNDVAGCGAYYALRTAIALAESWVPLGIANEWLGYSVRDFESNLSPADLGGPFFCRPPLHHMIFKSFEEKLSNVRGRFLSIRGHGSNVDGESVLWAARRLAARSEKRKILMVLCDGMPATWNGVRGPVAREADYGLLQDHLRYVVKQVTSSGIEVICFGCGTQAPAAYYNKETGAKFVGIMSIETMAIDIYRVMKERISKGV